VRRTKAIILVYLAGGPPHQDMVDLKPEAPAEVRGQFRPMATNVPVIQISELMPRVAAMMDKFAIICSLVGKEDRHSSFQCATGRLFRSRPQGVWPEVRSVLSKLHGSALRFRNPRTRLSVALSVARTSVLSRCPTSSSLVQPATESRMISQVLI